MPNIIQKLCAKVSKGEGKWFWMASESLPWAILDPKEALEGGGWEDEAEIQMGQI